MVDLNVADIFQAIQLESQRIAGNIANPAYMASYVPLATNMTSRLPEGHQPKPRGTPASLQALKKHRGPKPRLSSTGSSQPPDRPESTPDNIFLLVRTLDTCTFGC